MRLTASESCFFLNALVIGLNQNIKGVNKDE